jgi:hypothetical protein
MYLQSKQPLTQARGHGVPSSPPPTRDESQKHEQSHKTSRFSSDQTISSRQYLTHALVDCLLAAKPGWDRGGFDVGLVRKTNQFHRVRPGTRVL